MVINIICFTKKGLETAKVVRQSLNEEMNIKIFAKYEDFSDADETIDLVTGKLNQWTLSALLEKNALIFVGAVGIAVRAIASGVEDKLTDAPVLVIDELGQYVIPILSGHMGGANELALRVAERIGALPVITTATDIEGAFSPDLFAKENNLSIVNREGIAKVSAKALAGKPVRLCIEDFPPEKTDLLISDKKEYYGSSLLNLCPKKYALGVGCRKNTSKELLQEFIQEVLGENQIDISMIGAIGSVDLKANEQCLVDFARENRIPFITFTVDILKKAEGEYDESAFVEETVGVGNVCQRAAMLLSGNRGTVVVKKTARDGMTLAVVRME